MLLSGAVPIHGGVRSGRPSRSATLRRFDGRWLSGAEIEERFLASLGMTGVELAVTEALLIITGTMGAGKTTVLAEASDILTLRHVVHAAIDLDMRSALPNP